MAKTLIEASTKKRFASKFVVLEDHVPTEQFVLVFKDRENSPTFLVLEYFRDEGGKIQQGGTLAEMTEDEFKTKHAGHISWDSTTLREHDRKWSDWRSSNLTEKLEQDEGDEL